MRIKRQRQANKIDTFYREPGGHAPTRTHFIPNKVVDHQIGIIDESRAGKAEQQTSSEKKRKRERERERAEKAINGGNRGKGQGKVHRFPRTKEMPKF